MIQINNIHTLLHKLEEIYNSQYFIAFSNDTQKCIEQDLIKAIRFYHEDGEYRKFYDERNLGE